MEFFDKFISNTINSIQKIDISEIKLVINELKYLKNNSGRLLWQVLVEACKCITSY